MVEESGTEEVELDIFEAKVQFRVGCLNEKNNVSAGYLPRKS